MGIRKYNPTTPGRRGATVSDFAELTPGAKPVEESVAPEAAQGRAEQPGRDHRAASRRRSQAASAADRLPPQQGRHSRGGRLDPIRSEPQRADRPVALRGRRKAIHSGPRGLEGGRQGPSAAATRRRRWAIACRCRRFRWAWTCITSRCCPAGAACCAGRRAMRATLGRPRRRLGADQSAQRRNPPRAGHLPGHHRHDRQLRPHGHRAGQGRAASVGWAAGRTSAARP